MTDIVTKEQRSRNMAAIKSKETKPEIYFRKLLFGNGFRYRKNDSRLFGKPDIYLPKYKTVVFIHGCFWHRHPGCQLAYTPKTNTDFWTGKFEKNVTRDSLVQKTLLSEGYRVLIIWECTIRSMQKNPEYRDQILSQATAFIKSEKELLSL